MASSILRRINLALLAAILTVLLIAGFLRFWNLSSYPPSLSMDEIAYGYNAHSILKTGKDEYGKNFPLAFQSVGDYKPPTVVYLIAPSIALFGLNEFAIRLPEAVLGTLTPLIFIFILRELSLGWTASLLGGAWLAISPAHIFFSRAVFAGVAGLFFLLLGVLLFLIFLRKKTTIALWGSIVCFGLSIWSYHAQRLFVPLLVIFFLIISRKHIFSLKKNLGILLISTLTLLIFIAPFIYLTIFTQEIRARAIDLWFTKDPYLFQQLHEKTYESFRQFVFDNDLFLIFRYWAGQYLNYFDFRFWFWKGLGLTPPGYPDIGLLYVIDLPLVFLGIYSLLKSNNQLIKTLAIFWFFAGPLPASFTRGDPNALRALLWLPFFGVVIASGAGWFLEKIKNYKIALFYSLLVIANLFYFLDVYTNNFQKFYADLWHYGYKEVAQYSCQNWQKYDQVIVTDKYGSYWPSVKTVPHLYILFHCQWDPAKYLVDKNLHNIAIRQPQWRIDSKLPNALLVGSQWDFPEGFPKDKIMKTIYLPNGMPAFYFVETKTY